MGLLWNILKYTTLFLILGLLIANSVFTGAIAFTDQNIGNVNKNAAHTIFWVDVGLAVLLLLYLIVTLWPRKTPEQKAAEATRRAERKAAEARESAQRAEAAAGRARRRR